MARIMITDDAAFMRMMIRNILKKAGHEIIGEAVNGEDAVEKYQALQPDLVTMDITMPDMNGIIAVRHIRKFDPNAKIIMCSAMGQQLLVVDAIQAGAKDFIVKPFSEDRVLTAVNKVLGIHT